MPVLPPRRPPAPIRTLHCDTTRTTTDASLPSFPSPDTTLPCAALPRFATLATATACTHAILDAHSLPRAPLPPHRAAVAPRVPSSPSRPPPRPRHDRNPTHALRSPPRTTLLHVTLSTTVLALDHARLSDHRHSTTVPPSPATRPHDRAATLLSATTVPRSAPRHPSTGPFLDHATPDHDHGPTPRHEHPDMKDPATRGARPSHSSSHTITTRKARPRPAAAAAFAAAAPRQDALTTTVHDHDSSTSLCILSHTSRNIAGLTRRPQGHMSEVRARPRPARPPSPASPRSLPPTL